MKRKEIGFVCSIDEIETRIQLQMKMAEKGGGMFILPLYFVLRASVVAPGF